MESDYTKQTNEVNEVFNQTLKNLSSNRCPTCDGDGKMGENFESKNARYSLSCETCEGTGFAKRPIVYLEKPILFFKVKEIQQISDMQYVIIKFTDGVHKVLAKTNINGGFNEDGNITDADKDEHYRLFSREIIAYQICTIHPFE